MSALIVLIGISVLVAVTFLAAFLWSVSHGQYDDDYTPSVRILFDDATTTVPIKKPLETKSHTKKIKE